MTESQLPKPVTSPIAIRPVDRYELGDVIRTAWLKHGQDSWLTIADEVFAALAEPEPEGPTDEEPSVDHILHLAEIIREVDGNHSLGAAALAEAILSHPSSRWMPSSRSN